MGTEISVKYSTSKCHDIYSESSSFFTFPMSIAYINYAEVGSWPSPQIRKKDKTVLYDEHLGVICWCWFLQEPNLSKP